MQVSWITQNVIVFHIYLCPRLLLAFQDPVTADGTVGPGDCCVLLKVSAANKSLSCLLAPALSLSFLPAENWCNASRALLFSFFPPRKLLGDGLPRGSSSNTQSWTSQSKSVSECISQHLQRAQGQEPVRTRGGRFGCLGWLVLPPNTPVSAPCELGAHSAGPGPEGGLNQVGFMCHFLPLSVKACRCPRRVVGEGFSSIFYSSFSPHSECMKFQQLCN